MHVSTRRFTCGAQAYCLSQRERSRAGTRPATVPLRVHRDTRLVTAGTMELSGCAWCGIQQGRAHIARANWRWGLRQNRKLVGGGLQRLH